MVLYCIYCPGISESHGSGLDGMPGDMGSAMVEGGCPALLAGHISWGDNEGESVREIVPGSSIPQSMRVPCEAPGGDTDWQVVGSIVVISTQHPR